MKALTAIVRVLLGLVFVVFGANIFLHFIPMPPKDGLAGQYLGALAQSGYMNVVGIFQVVGGALLFMPRFGALGLALLLPVIVNILCFHIFMDPKGLPMALVVAVLALLLLIRYRANFAALTCV